MSYLHYLCIVVSNTYCVLFSFCFSSSCVPYVASFSGLSFLSHLAKGNVSFCHHLMSVVRRLSSVNFSHFNLLL
jgi:hypothetical protein